MIVSIKPTKNRIIVTDIESGDKITKGGLILPSDDGKERGIRPRWAKVHSVGSSVDDISPGEWVLISHGRWTRGVDIEDVNLGKTTVRMVDYPDAILLVSDELPENN